MNSHFSLNPPFLSKDRVINQLHALSCTVVVTVTVTTSALAATLGLLVITGAAGLMTIDRATLLEVGSGVLRKDVRRFSGTTASVGWFSIALDGLSVSDSGTCSEKAAGTSEMGVALPDAGSKLSEALVMSVIGVLAILGVSVAFAADGISEAEGVAMGKAEVGGVGIGLGMLADLTGEGPFVWLANELPLSAETVVVAWGLEDVFESWLEGFTLSCVTDVEGVP